MRWPEEAPSAAWADATAGRRPRRAAAGPRAPATPPEEAPSVHSHSPRPVRGRVLRRSAHDLRAADRATEWARWSNDFKAMQRTAPPSSTTTPTTRRRVQVRRRGRSHNALIRLKGWSSWWQAQVDNPPKMQFVIAFDGVDTHQRFHGLRKVELDMPRIDPIVPAPARRARVPARAGRARRSARTARACSSTAPSTASSRTSSAPTRSSSSACSRARTAAICGTAAGSSRPTRTTMGLPHPRLDAFWAAKTPSAIAAIADMDEALLEWAAEAMLADRRRLLDRPLELLPLRSPDARLAVASARPRRGHRLDRPRIDPLDYWGGDPGWAPPWQHYVAVIKDYALARALRRRASPRVRGLGGGAASRDARSLRGADPRRRRRRSHASVHLRRPPERRSPTCGSR